MVTAQDIAHRNFVDAMPQVCQGPLDATVTPRRVLLRHAYDDLFDCLGDTRSAKRFALLAAVELVCNQSLVPAQEGLGRGKRGEFLQTFTTERVGQCRKAAAFSISEAEPTAT